MGLANIEGREKIPLKRIPWNGNMSIRKSSETAAEIQLRN